MRLDALTRPVGLRWIAPLLVAGLLLLTLPGTARSQETMTLPPGVQTAVQAAVATRANVAQAEVDIVRSEQVIWQNGCMGIPSPSGACTLIILTGFVVWAEAGGTTYRYHTNYTGSDVRFAESGVDATTDPIPEGAELVESNEEALPDALATAVRSDAATRTSTTASTVEILRVEEVTWNDACLGVQAQGEFCAEVLTDGFVVWVAAGTQVLRYHTDTASAVRFAEGGLDRATVPLYELPEGAQERVDDGTPPPTSVIQGEVPSTGVALLTVTATATPAEIRAALLDQGCTPALIAITVQGDWQTYRYIAPDFVNVGFPANLESGRQFAAQCYTPSTGGGGGGTPPPASDFPTDDIDESDRTGNGALVDVSIGEHAGFDRIVFEFADDLAGPLDVASGVPPYALGYVSSASECGSGNAVNLQGTAMLLVDLPGTFIYNPETGTQLVNAVEFGDDHQVILQVEEICGFEGNSQWLIGLDAQAGFRVSELSSPTRLVIDIEAD